ncbi:hemerythrin domain-containing protein [Candidatus Nitrotoga sp. 1052]|uniref:hemerythrin domain-containing protein n=1 Tax=Candidatus Nitrotoga sp. 1052 TaxID=2886964 RepID=UPI001EF728B0|nr:hemerythrin domain-containing protein [Candidatus Nitrotoga sp. 1052]CAH1089914.1 Hemerythrin domain-containing protein [Candidatus Nitrotoga sp. 1052]
MSDLLVGGVFVPGFDNPLEILLACHGKIQTQCATLRMLLQHLSSYGCDSQARQAAQAILRYFDTAGQNHHDDEEQDLFPRLLATPNAEVHELIARLLDEHKVLDAAWQQLRPLLLAIAEGRATELDVKSVEHFITVHDRHISLENTQLLPQAAILLDHMQLEALGRSMAARRGVVFSNRC